MKCASNGHNNARPLWKKMGFEYEHNRVNSQHSQRNAMCGFRHMTKKMRRTKVWHLRQKSDE